MTNLEKLIRHFEKFPGIGSRQARRFAFHLLTESKENVAELSELISSIQNAVSECPSCFRFFSRYGNEIECTICSNTLRDRTKLLVVERDTDVDATERSRVYDGLYFVLGGTVPLLDSREDIKVRGGALKHTVEARLKDGLKEIILAFGINPDGENTARYVQHLIRDLIAETPVTISELGRGLSTGSELEYADPETIKHALQARRRIA
jgi:recombination protein RecR